MHIFMTFYLKQLNNMQFKFKTMYKELTSMRPISLNMNVS